MNQAHATQVLWRGDELRRTDDNFSKWQKEAYAAFGQTIHDPQFPCFFAPVAAKKDSLRFTFIEGSSKSDLEVLARATSLYLEEVRRIERRSIKDAAFQILVAFVRTPEGISLEEEQELAWGLLAGLHRLDPKPWPAEVSQDPSDPRWSFCWGGTALFVNISASAHRHRRSRRLANRLVLVIQPRDAFDSIAGDTPKGRHLRAEIRDRIKAYDSLPASPLLGTYGKPGSLEWVQYGLPEHNGKQTASVCPFQRLLGALSFRPRKIS